MREGFFASEFLKSLPSDNLIAANNLFKEYERFNNSTATLPPQQLLAYHDDFVEMLAIFQAFTDFRAFSKGNFNVALGANQIDNIKQIRNQIGGVGNGWRNQLNTRTANSLCGEKNQSYAAFFDAEKTYEFSDNDIQRVQKLTNELRDLIAQSNLITAYHKRRLLKRLEAMQQEIHKHTSDIDRFWGFIAEAGIVSRKFGEDLKPITDRVSEIASIVISVIKLKEGVGALPEIPQLLQIPQKSEGNTDKETK